MTVKIVGKEVKENQWGYYLEISLSEYVNREWESAYQEALMQEQYVSMRGSGCPTINKLIFEGDIIRTNNFQECAMPDIPAFLKELEARIEISNRIYNSKVTYRKQQEEAERRLEQNKKAKLAELNKKLNS